MRSFHLLSVVLASFSLAFVALPASGQLGREEPQPGSVGVNILHVTPTEFTHYLKDYDTAIVFYYVEWCRTCARLQAVYARASYLLEQQQQQQSLAAASGGSPPRRKRMVFAAVNCGTNYQGCIQTGVRRVPVFKRVRNGGIDVEILPLRMVNAKTLLDAITA